MRWIGGSKRFELFAGRFEGFHLGLSRALLRFLMAAAGMKPDTETDTTLEA